MQGVASGGSYSSHTPDITSPEPAAGSQESVVALSYVKPEVVKAVGPLSVSIKLSNVKVASLEQASSARPVCTPSSLEPASSSKPDTGTSSTDIEESVELDAPMSSLARVPEGWEDGIERDTALFTEFDGFINHCMGQLNKKDQKICKACLREDSSEQETRSVQLEKLREKCSTDEEAMRTYAVYLLAKGNNFVMTAIRLNDLRPGQISLNEKDIQEYFFGETPRELHALGIMFGRSYARSLRAKACQETKEGRNATYWLVKLLRDTHDEIGQVVSALNRTLAVSCPFGNTWTHMDVHQMLGTKVGELLSTLDKNPGNRTPSQVIFTMINRGDMHALESYIMYWRKKGQEDNKIADKLRNKVCVPGPQAEGRKWTGAMVKTVLEELALPPEKISHSELESRPSRQKRRMEPEPSEVHVQPKKATSDRTSQLKQIFARVKPVTKQVGSSKSSHP